MRIHRVGYLLAFIVLVSASGAVKADERIKVAARILHHLDGLERCDSAD